MILPDFSQSVRAVAAPEKPKEMLSVTFVDGRPHVRINSSSLSLIQTCPRKSFYTLNQQWRAKAGSTATLFGSAIHKALEVFYSSHKHERSIPANFEERALTMLHGFEAPEPHFLFDAVAALVKAGEPLKALPDTDKHSLSTGIWILSHYFKTYINDAYTILVDEQGPVTERTFSLPLIDKPDLFIEYFGTIDFILKNEATEAILPGDHKTSSQMGKDFFNRIKPNHQYTGYLIGVQRVFGIQTDSFLVNGIQVKSRPLTSRGTPPTLVRQITKRSEADIAEFETAVEAAVRTYLNWQLTETWALGNVDSCAMWGACHYLDVCSAPGSLRQNILESKFEVSQ